MAEQTSISYYQTEFKFNDDRTSKKGPVDLFSEGARLSRREKRELDSETGMYYYGARYYDPSLSIWMSVDPLAEQFPNFSPYNYTMNNPINMIDPDGRAPESKNDIIIKGTPDEQKAYLAMLHASTGNKYSVDSSGKLKNDGADSNFKGSKSAKLASVIDKGINSKTVHTLTLTGGKSDDKAVFIDSYKDKKIDLSDLKKIGKESIAFQGATIGHFLNEVQEAGGFDPAHKASKIVEGTIFGELSGNSAATARTDVATAGAVNGYQSVTYSYGVAEFTLQQGATSTSVKTTKPTVQFGITMPPGTTVTETKGNGELKSVKKTK